MRSLACHQQTLVSMPVSLVVGPRTRFVVHSPIGVLVAALLIAALLLGLGLPLPIGPMYWDVYQYIDASQRIFSGQVPINDFVIPVGPLGYYLFAVVLSVFPNAQPLLVAQWSVLLVTGPLMAAVVWDASKRSRAVAFALLAPFLFFALLPFNTQAFYPLPGVDGGVGIYNRQVCQLLYVVVAGVLFVRNRKVSTAVLAVGMSALFFTKITGFVAGAMISLYGTLAGRIRLRDALAAAAAFIILLAGLELTTGMVGNYLRDILDLVGMNTVLLAPRFLQAGSLNFGVLVPAGMLALLLLWVDRRMLSSVTRSAVKLHSAARASAALDHGGLWLLVVIFAGTFNETQNTGSQALIFLWPVCLRILLRLRRFDGRPVVLIAALALIGAAVLPPIVNVSERAARAVVGSAKNLPLESHNLKGLGDLTMRPEVAQRVQDMLEFYPGHHGAFDDMVAMGDEVTPLVYSDLDFQALYLANVDRAIDAIHRLEADRGVRFETIMTVAPYNVFPWLMDRRAPLRMSIAADPLRTVDALDGEERRALADTDLVLYSTCPQTVMDARLLALYRPALAQHRVIKLNDCYDAYLNPRFAGHFDG
jgi:hypothetical protein